METQRDRFTAVAGDLLAEDPRIAVLLAEIGAERFAAAGLDRRFPQRLINVGIREQLLIGAAAGLALEGFRPIVHSYAPFLVERAFEQLKLDLGHQGGGAILVSVGASHDWAAGGHTHHAPGDIALLSTLAGWRVHVPGHPDEVETLLRAAAAREAPTYIRLSEDRNAEALPVAKGAFQVVRREPDARATVIVVGPLRDRVLAAARDLPVNLLYAATVRPFDRETLRAVAEVPQIVLVEPYLAGTSAAEVAGSFPDRPHRLLSLGVAPGELRRYGSAAEHDAAHGLDVAGLRASLLAFIAG